VETSYNLIVVETFTCAENVFIVVPFSTIDLHGVVLNSLSTETTLPYLTLPYPTVHSIELSFQNFSSPQ
jgi:hypothetical protein